MRIIRTLTISGLLCLSQFMLGETVVYTPDTTTNFCNPERGFYYHSEQKVTTQGKTNMSTSTFSTARNAGSTLLLRLYYLDNFRKKDLPEAVLNQITSDFALFRTNGCKAVLRFAYDNDNDDGYQDASPAIWKSHLLQLKPILQANADVITVVQAGFMGAWGEWYFSSQGVGEDIPQKVKNDLIDELLDAVPVSRAVQLRTPDYKRDYFNYRKESKDALTSAEAFTGTARARLGHHNDAFLYQSDNMGTYSDREKDMDFLDQECLYLPNGGETDVYKESVYKDWATGDKAQAEMAKLHYSYLNQGYCALTLNHWREDGSFDILARHMGYRLQLLETTIPASAAMGGKLSVKMSIKNVGYAPMYNERKAYIVLRNASKTYTFLLNSDPRRWLPNGEVTTINETISLPNDIPTGTYDVCLWLPDMGEAIKNDSRFAIRLANKNVWEDETGYNVLTTIAISKQGDPDPKPTPGDTLDLPATLCKANVAATHENMTYYSTDYFDFGPNDSEDDLALWADWNVRLVAPGKYDVTAIISTTAGWEFLMELKQGDQVVSSFNPARSWDTNTTQNLGTWDLTNVAKGIYTIRVQNVFGWSPVKLKSVEFTTNPSMSISTINDASSSASQKILMNGSLRIIHNGQVFTVMGQSVTK